MQCINIDIVIIGIQSETSLASCVKSVKESLGNFNLHIIYVDGGSTDKTLEIAYSLENIEVVKYSKDTPSPGGQRNAGWRRGTAEFVMFLDSDTELNPYFLYESIQILQKKENKYIGAVFGKRNEKYPNASVFNFIGDIEWNPPFQKYSAEYYKVHQSKTGNRNTHAKVIDAQERITQSRFTRFFGGDVVVQRKVLEVTGGYDESLIAGEDPELALRCTLHGFAIWYECIEMTKHDLGYALKNHHKKDVCKNARCFFEFCELDIYIYIFFKIIKRLYRTGYGYASVVWMYTFQKKQRYHDFNNKINVANKFWKYELYRIVIRGWGSFLTICVILASLFNYDTFILLLDLLLSDQNLYVFCYTIYMCFLFVVFCLLLLYPRLFSVKKLMNMFQISRNDAKIYAWYCSIIVIPQSLGLFRFLLAKVTGNYLVNNKPKVKNKSQEPNQLKKALEVIKKIVMNTVNMKNIIVLCVFSLISIFLFSCAPRLSPRIDSHTEDILETTKDDTSAFRTKLKKKDIFSNKETVFAVSEALPDDYLLGAGDVLSLDVWNRPKLSDPHIVVAPDGKITVMRIGVVHVGGRSIDDVIYEIETRLQHFYKSPEVRLSITTYKNNKAFVLGRVTNPGLIEFSGRGTLLEALARAGGLPILSEKSFLTKCAIIRGKKQILWIDLRDLLQNGNMALNARIYNDDIIFIPESENEVVYIMGEVLVPGAIQLKSEMTYLDALMFSGGPTKSADLSETFVIRFEDGKRRIRRVNLRRMLEEGDGSQNFVLHGNDVIYVSETGMASFNYAMQKILPALEVLNLGTSVLERFGVMENLRGRWYGTEGFVDGE